MQLRTTITATARSPGRQVASALPHKAHLATSSIISHPVQHHSFPPRCIHLFHGWSISTTRVPYKARSNVQAEHESLIFSSLEHFQALSRVERFPKGLPTTSLHFLQVSEAESQSITSCEPFHIAVAALAIISSCRPSMPHELCCHCSTV